MQPIVRFRDNTSIGLLKIDSARTPQQKLEFMRQCTNIIRQGLAKFAVQEDPSGEAEMMPMFLYVLIMAAPRMIHSNLK